MAKYRFKETKKDKKPKHTAFAVLCVCMVAVGAAAWFALDSVDNNDPRPNDTANISSTESTGSQGTVFDTVSGETGKVTEGVVSNVPKPDTEDTVSHTASTEPEVQETVTEASFFVMPVAGSITKEYSGEELIYSETFTDYRSHKGVDIGAAVGTAVNSAGHGVVKDIYEDEILGTVVEIDHGNGIICYYCGLNSKPLVAEGDAVEPSQPLGAVGTLPGECVEAPHLHLEVKKDGEYVSPLEFLGLN